MGLQCKKCGSTNTNVTTKDKLQEASKKAGTGVNIPTSGFISKEVAVSLIDLATAVFKFFGSQKETYVICETCGYYEKQ